MSKSVLVTGSTGFIGSYVVPMLEQQGFKVYGDHALPASIDLLKPASIANAIELAKPDYIVHLAGISRTDHKDSALFYEVNTIGSLNLMLALQDANCTPVNLIAASTASVYGITTETTLHEQLCPVPANDYGISKLSMEGILRQWREHFPITCARIFNCTGLGQSEDFVIPKIVSAFKHNQDELRLGNIDTIREYNDVRWLAAALIQLLITPRSFEAINVCTGIGKSLRDVLGVCRQLSNFAPAISQDASLLRKNEIHSLLGDPHLLDLRIGAVESYSTNETIEWMLEK